MGDHRGGAGVVDHDVEPAVALDARPDEPLGVGGIRDVGLHVDRVGQFGRELLAFGHRRHGVDHDAGTEVGEGGGDGGTDPAR